MNKRQRKKQIKKWCRQYSPLHSKDITEAARAIKKAFEEIQPVLHEMFDALKQGIANIKEMPRKNSKQSSVVATFLLSRLQQRN